MSASPLPPLPPPSGGTEPPPGSSSRATAGAAAVDGESDGGGDPAGDGGSEGARRVHPSSRSYRVTIGWRSLTYLEGEETEPIKIYIEPPNRYGQPFAFYIPGEERWRQVMPVWSVDRRVEIVRRIKEECSHYHAEWVEG